MTSHAHRRQILLFLVAVILPCSVLVALSLRMIGQERELGEKRLADERRRVTNQINQELLARLERIKLQEASAAATEAGTAQVGEYENPAVALVSPVENNRLVLPWESDRKAQESRQLLAESEFAGRIQEGEREELVANDFARATALYREATDQARRRVQATYARLLLARAIAKAGRRREALRHYRTILASSSQLTDEHGVPLSLYAATRLLEAGVGHRVVLERIRSEVATREWLPPTEVYMLRRLANTLVESAPDTAVSDEAKELEQMVAEHIRYLEQALALQRDFPNLGLGRAGATDSQDAARLWVLYGEDPWLVSMAPALGTLPSVGELLGASFPDLRVRFLAEDGGTLAKPWNLQRPFYLVTLLLVLSLTFFGAYLLWRDVRRELRLAEMRSQFVSGVSHELKTPLTAIRMFAETLRMGRSADPGMRAEYLDTIVNESERLTRLLNNVLDFSKIEQGKKSYRLKPNSLVEIVNATARAMQYPLEQQGFELHVHVENEMPTVQVDRDAIEQAILNLLTNAIKYSGDSRDIDLRLRMEDRQALIEVSDHGVGIDPAEQGRIFERFYRAPTPENRLIPGTGLGLTLVEHIAKAHGGRVEVKSTPGEGSTFSMHLPLEGET